MPDITPLNLTHNPFDPTRVDPSDLVTIPVGAKVGLNDLNAKFQKYLNPIQRMSLPQLQSHMLVIQGPHMGGRSSFCRLVTQRLMDRLGALGINADDVFTFENNQPLLLGEDKGPNESLRDIFLDLLSKMQNDSRRRFSAISFKDAKRGFLEAKRLADICNVFILYLEEPLRDLGKPTIFIFENLHSVEVYSQLVRALRNVTSIRIVSAFSGSDVGRYLIAVHRTDNQVFFLTLESLEMADILALIQHNLKIARTGQADALFPFQRAAIEKFFESPNARLQPFGRIVKACFRSLESKISELDSNPNVADVPLSHDYMLRAYELG
jgi:hypothetical protein